MKQLMTKWGKELDVNNLKQEYPRPNMVRKSYINLNGPWECCINNSTACSEYDKTIIVPFSPESVLSGVSQIVQPENYLHYRKAFTIPQSGPCAAAFRRGGSGVHGVSQRREAGRAPRRLSAVLL